MGAAGGHDRYAASCLASSADRPEPNRAEPDVNVPSRPITVADALAALQFATAADPEQRKVLRKALLAALSALEEDEDR